MRYILTSLLTLLLLPVWGAEGDVVTVDLSDVQLPKKAVQAEDRFALELANAADRYRRAVDAARVRALKTLEGERKRSRDTMVALAIKTRMDRIEKVGATDVFGNPIGNPIVDQTDLTSVLIGKTFNNVTKNGSKENPWSFGEDGKLTIGKNYVCKYVIENTTLTVDFNSGNTVVFSKPITKGTLESTKGSATYIIHFD